MPDAVPDAQPCRSTEGKHFWQCSLVRALGP